MTFPRGRLRRSMEARGKYGGSPSIPTPAASQAGIAPRPTSLTRRATTFLRQKSSFMKTTERNETPPNAKADRASAASAGAVRNSIGLGPGSSADAMSSCEMMLANNGRCETNEALASETERVSDFLGSRPASSMDATRSLELMLSNYSEVFGNDPSSKTNSTNTGGRSNDLQKTRRLSTSRVNAINRRLDMRRKADLDDASSTSKATADTAALTSGLSSLTQISSDARDQEVIFLLSKVVKLLSDKSSCAHGSESSAAASSQGQEQERLEKNMSFSTPAKGKDFGEGADDGSCKAEGGSEKDVIGEAAPRAVLPVSNITFRRKSASRTRRGPARNRPKSMTPVEVSSKAEASDGASRRNSTGLPRTRVGRESHVAASNEPQASRGATFRARSQNGFGNELGAAAARKETEQATPIASNRARARCSLGAKPRYGNAPSHMTPHALMKVRERRRQELRRPKKPGPHLPDTFSQDRSTHGGGSQVRATMGTERPASAVVNDATSRARGNKNRGRSTSRSKMSFGSLHASGLASDENPSASSGRAVSKNRRQSSAT